MEIPYTTKVRPDTGLWNAKIGIWLFLASEVMLFGGLFASYIVLRVNATDWPRGSDMLSVPIGTFNTFVLISSSITIVLAWASLVMKKFTQYRIYMALTIFCGILFLVVKCGWEYPAKFRHYTVEFKDGHKQNGHIEGALDRKADHFEFLADPPKDEHKGEHHGEHGAAKKIEMKDVKRVASWGPWQNTYFGIYFTITALHGLHVLGGTIVNLYLLLPGAKMWKTQPQRFTNRVEVSGLFWHFVDLVWIFLFPVLYLM